MAKSTASVGVDVDSLCHYYRIHGLDEVSASNAAWEVGVPRFVELFREVGVPASFYCIAEDLDVEGNDTRIRALADAGHEIGNHTENHRYDLSRLSDAEMAFEVGHSRQRLSDASGQTVVGFRAPGYNTNARLVRTVFSTGHTYDSSVFPCTPYYLAKASVMRWLHFRGRPSKSILGTPRVLMAPRAPYTMSLDEPHRRAPSGPLQYPISVVAGVPLIGTAFTALGSAPSAAVARLALLQKRHLTLEFHAVDLLSLTEDGLDPRLAVQPDLKVSVKHKRNAFVGVLETIARVRRFERLDHLTDTYE
jgi:hypothetical protein